MELYVQEVNLQDENLVKIPPDKIRFITVHPSLEEKIVQMKEGFTFDNQYKKSQNDLIQATFPLVKSHPSNTDSHANFLIFPEISVTNEGLDIIENAIQKSSWPENSIVMGGLEYISGKRFKNLLDNSDNPHETKRLPNNIASFNINTSFIYIKTNGKKLRKYYQPKMSSSPPEQRLQDQFRGSYLLLFRTKSMAFTQIICFDAIVEPGDRFEPLANNIITKLRSYGSALRPLRIGIYFVLQHNEHPNKACFKKFAKRLLEKPGYEVIIDTVIFVNSAADKLGCSERYGKSRFHFLTPRYQVPSANEVCIPSTFCLREEGSIKCAQFREDGPCVHSFEYITPPATGVSSGVPHRLPFDYAFMHKISNDGSIGKGEAINGLWKKVFDFLPDHLPDTDVNKRWTADRGNRTEGLNLKLRQKFEGIRNNLVTDGVQLNRLEQITDLLFLGYGEDQRTKRIKNPDYWKDHHEGEGIKDLASGLTIFALLGDIALEKPSLSKVHTALFREADMDFYLAIIDDPTNGLLVPRLRRKYNDFVNDEKWGDIDWSKHTLLLFCIGNRAVTTDKGVTRDENFTNPKETSIIPVDLSQREKTRFDSAKSHLGLLFYCGLDNLRGDLGLSCDEIIPQWRRKLEPLKT